MIKSHLFSLGLLVASSALFAGCSSDIKSGPTNAEAGAGAEAGSGDEAAAGSNDGFQFPDALNPQAVVVPAPGPASSEHVLIAGTDFSSTEIVSITLGNGAVGEAEVYPDGDTIPVSSAGIGFAIERGSDKVHLLDGGKISTTFDLRQLGTDDAPVDSKAYVPFLNQSAIAILDLTEGKVSRRIDLSAYGAATDSDHSVDIADGVYDVHQHIAYFMLQRIDRNAIAKDPEYRLQCTPVKALIVGIDATSDALVDLNGAAQGKAIELELADPSSLSINPDGTHLYLSASGCYEGGVLKHQGAEVVDLSDGTTHIAYAPPADSDSVSRLLLIGGSDALIQTQDASYAKHWYRLDLAAGERQGEELKDVPESVSFDGTDLIGVQVTGTTGAVVRYELGSGTSTVLSPTSWAGKYGTAYGSALVQ